jgi:hypothetical protein
MYQMPASIAFFAVSTGAFLWTHIVLTLIVRFAVRFDKRAVNGLFAPPSHSGLILFKSCLMRVKLFFPWVAAGSMNDFSKPLRTLIWTARLAGTGLIVSFLFLVSDFAYRASSGA